MGALNSQENSFSVYNSLLSHIDTDCGSHKLKNLCVELAVLLFQCIHFQINWHGSSQAKGKRAAMINAKERQHHTESGGELLQEILHRIITNATNGEFKLLSYSFRSRGGRLQRSIWSIQQEKTPILISPAVMARGSPRSLQPTLLSLPVFAEQI